MKRVILLAMLLISLVSASAVSEPSPVAIDEVYINGVQIDKGVDYGTVNYEVRGDIERGEVLEVKVKLFAYETSDNVQVSVEFFGDDHTDIDERTQSFDVKAGQSYVKTIKLNLPRNLDSDKYTLRVEVANRRGFKEVKMIDIDISTPRHAVLVDDVIFSPSDLIVQAGRSITAKVRLENFGAKDEDDIKVVLDVKGVGSASDYVDEVENEEEKSSQELYLRIPECTPAGQYKTTVTVSYDDHTKTVQKEYTLDVVASDRCTVAGEDKTVIGVGSEVQNVIAGGSEAVYPIALTNSGKQSKTYSLDMNVGDWASGRLSSSVLVVNPGETKVAYAFVSAKKEASPGEKIVGVTVKSNDQPLKTLNLRANVVAQKTGIFDGVREGLLIAFVVLVVILIIVGLVWGFSRLKGGEEKEDEKTYY